MFSVFVFCFVSGDVVCVWVGLLLFVIAGYCLCAICLFCFVRGCVVCVCVVLLDLCLLVCWYVRVLLCVL